VVQRSDEDEPTEGEIAEGGGEITIVLPSVFTSDLLSVVVFTVVVLCAKDVVVETIKNSATIHKYFIIKFLLSRWYSVVYYSIYNLYVLCQRFDRTIICHTLPSEL